VEQVARIERRRFDVAEPYRIAVVVPCFKVKRHVVRVLQRMGPEVWRVYVVDDCCPEGSGRYVEEHCTDSRVTVLYQECNQGVGGAVIAGYRKAIADGADVIVKVDGDGQMDPALITELVSPILNGEADYAKGNRFFDPANVQRMPGVRSFGNAGLSFLAKLSTGYWRMFDPNNGYTAIHAEVARRLPLERVSRRYFFETDMLFRLNTVRAAVVDVPMDPIYADEVSNLSIRRVFFEFLGKHLRNTAKRILYNYFLRDLSLASLELAAGLVLFFAGALYGAVHWLESARAGVVTPAGTVMLAALPVILGIQFVLAFLAYDIAAAPTRAIHVTLRSRARAARAVHPDHPTAVMP